MGKPSDFSLAVQARELLSQYGPRRGEPGLTTELLNLAVACHGRMLELGESDQPAAVELAIAGADLLQALAELPGPSATLPAWAPIHEEQCCRYGALWIHSLLLQGHPLSQQRRQRCGELLNRLEQLHPEPVPWIATIRHSLEPSGHAPEATSDLRLVVVGNCQAHPLMLGLRQALPQVRLHACPSVHLASHDDVTHLHRRLCSTDLLVMHRVQPGYRDGIGLDSDTLRATLPASARSVVLPNLHYEGHHPWISYAQDPDDRLAALEPESPLGPYHDFLAMVAARDGLPLETLLDPAGPPGRLDHLRHQHEQSLAELKNRETDCDIGLSDWLASQHRHRPLAHTINHPTQAALDQLLRRLLQHLGLPHQLGDEIFDATEYLGALSIPIHPWVRQALQLDSWADRWGQRQGNALPIEQQLQESVDFYHRHPWIAAANAQHPKLLLAEELLIQARTPAVSPPTPTGPACDSPATLYQCLWVSATPLKALQDLGQWLLAQPPGDHLQLQQLVEAASRTRDPNLITPALTRLASHPPPEPWYSHFDLQLQHAAGAPGDALHRLARQAFAQHHAGGHPWDESSWRPLTVLLHQDDNPELQASLHKVLAVEAPLEQACHGVSNGQPASLLAARAGIDPEEAHRAGGLYARCRPSLRRPYAHWADPEAADPAVLHHLIERICQARTEGQGFSLVRLGDGEGLFLSGRRPDIGGATCNGTRIEARLAGRGNQLEDPEHEQLRRRLTAAVANADWIGIPDLPQCLTGPIDGVTVANGLVLMLNPEQRRRAEAHLVVGGCHVHNYLLQAGDYTRAPFDRVQAVIGPSLPLHLQGQEDLIWLQIPGEAGFRPDAFGSEAHYPAVFERILAAIEQRIGPGDLVLVGAGILGKIYCEAVSQRGGVAVDVGSVIDLCSGHGGTRGEYRMHPWLHRPAEAAFTPA